MFHLFQGDNIVLTLSNGDTFTINRTSNPNFDELVDAINAGDEETIRVLANPARALQAFYSDSGDTTLEVFGNRVTLNESRLAPALEDRLLSMYEAKLPLGPLVNFMERVRANPSYTARQELYLFLEGNQLPLTADGYFMAYKSVKRWTPDSGYEADDLGRPFQEGDFMSIGRSRINNLPTRYRVGDVVEQERGEVDDCRENTCSNGLHFASLDYASTWTSWDALLLMKIDPADVVSIPNDYNNQKGRTCRFTVHSIHSENAEVPVQEAFDSPVYDTGDLGPAEHGKSQTVHNNRWQVCAYRDDTVLATYASREQARTDKWSRRDGSCYIYDTLNDRVVT